MVNVYTPNEDDPNFFKTLAEHIENFQKDKILIGGNFNPVLDRQFKEIQGNLLELFLSLKESHARNTEIKLSQVTQTIH